MVQAYIREWMVLADKVQFDMGEVGLDSICQTMVGGSFATAAMQEVFYNQWYACEVLVYLQ